MPPFALLESLSTRPSCTASTADPRGAMMSMALCFRTPPSRAASYESSRRVLSIPATGKYRLPTWARSAASDIVGSAGADVCVTAPSETLFVVAEGVDALAAGALGDVGTTRKGARWEQAVSAHTIRNEPSFFVIVPF